MKFIRSHFSGVYFSVRIRQVEKCNLTRRIARLKKKSLIKFLHRAHVAKTSKKFELKFTRFQSKVYHLKVIVLFEIEKIKNKKVSLCIHHVKSFKCKKVKNNANQMMHGIYFKFFKFFEFFEFFKFIGSSINNSNSTLITNLKRFNMAATIRCKSNERLFNLTQPIAIDFLSRIDRYAALCRLLSRPRYHCLSSYLSLRAGLRYYYRTVE